MNKNLKKVISSVVALALSLGSLSAFAASYSDVADTANYATAVNELSALGIVNGYEDGTFQPDKKVTRAEVTKMVVAALAQTAAADAAKGATAFSDVAADHWAAGFINVGSNSSGFINGMGDGTFAPEANVTYAQLVKMLVTSLGYGGMALQEGGYPTGYITVGDRIGVTKAVVANANDELTRGQVALLINNSVNIPLLVTTVWSAANPEYEIKDGTGKYFQSLLTEYHDTYKVEGKITATNRTNDSYDPDEASFNIAVADRFDDTEWFTRSNASTSRDQKVKVVDGIDVNANLFTYSSALIHKNADDEYELISLSSTARSKSVELSAGAFDDDNKDYNGNAANEILNNNAALKYYANDDKSGKVTDYKVAKRGYDSKDNTVELRVNGVQVDLFLDIEGQVATPMGTAVANLNKYVVNNKAGKVTLVDAPQDNKATTDGYYDYILVDYYASAVVDEVQSNGTVYFDSKQSDMKSNIKFDQDKVEDGDLTYKITLDGKEIDYTDLQPGDVISVAYDVTKDFDKSAFYDVIVTRGTVEGKIETEDNDDETYEVNGTSYKYDANLLGDGYKANMVGTQVELYVDAFGRVVKLDEASSSKKYAILDNVYTKSGDDLYYARIILPDTTTKEYEIKNTSDVTPMKSIVGSIVNGYTVKADIENRVVTYKVDSSERIHTVVRQNAIPAGTSGVGDYAAKSNKIGSLKLNDNTAIIDASDYVSSANSAMAEDGVTNTNSGKLSDLATVSSLVDDNKYTAYGFDKLSDNTYSFVIITNGVGGYTDDTQIAVFSKKLSKTNKDGDSNDAIEVLFEGEVKQFLIDSLDNSDVNAIANINSLDKGDVITFKLNSDDEVTQINRLAAFGGMNYATIRNNAFAKSIVIKELNKWNKTATQDTDVDVWFGPIVDKSSNTVTLGAELTVSSDAGWTAAASMYDTSVTDKDLTLTDDTKVYVYDFGAGKNDAFTPNPNNSDVKATKADIVKTSVPSKYKHPDTDLINWNTTVTGVVAADGSTSDVLGVLNDTDLYNGVNFAFARTDNDEVLEIFVILADN